MLCLPVTTSFRRRTKDVLLDLLITISSQHTLLVLCTNTAGRGLLDGLAFLLQGFFTSQLSIACSPEAQALVLRYHGGNLPHFEECHEAVLCLQILINLARQRMNHTMLLTHTKLISLISTTASHPLISEQMLKLTFRFISLIEGYIPTLDALSPNNALMESVVSTMEHYARTNLTSLICPFYLPNVMDANFQASVLSIAYAFARCAHRQEAGSQTISRLTAVVTNILASDLEHPEAPFNIQGIAEIAMELSYRSPAIVVREAKFVLVMTRLARHSLCGTAARRTLRSLWSVYPSLRRSNELVGLLEQYQATDCQRDGGL